MQISPFLIDVADTSLGDTVGRARGVAIDYSCFHNDRRQGDRDPVGLPVPTEREISDAVGSADVAVATAPHPGAPTGVRSGISAHA